VLTQAEARELVQRSHLQRRRPTAAFCADRAAARARRRMEGHPSPIANPEAIDWAGLWSEMMPPVAGGASYFNIVLDTTAPAGVTLALNGNASYATSRSITASVGTSDTPTTGYQMKLWGDVDPAANASIQATEGASQWIALTASQAVTVSTGDGSKSINLRIRDDVWNESTIVTKSITLDTTVPVVTIQAGSPDVSKVSMMAGKDTVTIAWQSDSPYQAFEVAVVASGTSLRGSGTVIPNTAGSTNVSGNPGAGTPGPANTNVTTTIRGADLRAASAADGTKVIKIFVQDVAGSWSIA
jgi:hypothetical protein